MRAEKGKEGRLALSLMMKVLGKEVTRAGIGCNDMDYMHQIFLF